VKTITLDDITWELPYWDLLPPLSAPAFEELKDDIEDKGGNIYPVLWTPLLGGDRRVIDGGHRLRAVSELRQEGHTAVALNEQCPLTPPTSRRFEGSSFPDGDEAE